MEVMEVNPTGAVIYEGFPLEPGPTRAAPPPPPAPTTIE
jgi:hypothetical protein